MPGPTRLILPPSPYPVVSTLKVCRPRTILSPRGTLTSLEGYMSVQSVQLHGLEQAPPVRIAGPAGSAPPRAADEQRGPVQPQDQVIVSEQARKLSAGAGSGTSAGSGADGEVELQLDFRKLRELAAATSSSNETTQSA
jgi:hypothetical protein